MAYFTKEINSCLAKILLNFNGGLAKLELTFIKYVIESCVGTVTHSSQRGTNVLVYDDSSEQNQLQDWQSLVFTVIK